MEADRRQTCGGKGRFHDNTLFAPYAMKGPHEREFSVDVLRAVDSVTLLNCRLLTQTLRNRLKEIDVSG